MLHVDTSTRRSSDRAPGNKQVYLEETAVIKGHDIFSGSRRLAIHSAKARLSAPDGQVPHRALARRPCPSVGSLESGTSYSKSIVALPYLRILDY
jgi:hypothetical protein